MQLIALDKLDQFTGILRIGGVTIFPQSVGPTHVIRRLEIEEGFVMAAFSDEERMILERLFGGGVFAKAFQATIIVFIEIVTFPVSTFDAEMIVSLDGQVTLPSSRFEDTLGQRDAGRYAMFLLLLNSRLMIGLDILFTSIQISDLGSTGCHTLDKRRSSG